MIAYFKLYFRAQIYSFVGTELRQENLMLRRRNVFNQALLY
jgi:hypothetical protein